MDRMPAGCWWYGQRNVGDAVMNERPISPPLRQSETDPAWIQVINLFQRHGMTEPPVALRDELVVALQWAWYGQQLDASLAEQEDPFDFEIPSPTIAIDTL
jgi:hypothetical protein